MATWPKRWRRPVAEWARRSGIAGAAGVERPTLSRVVLAFVRRDLAIAASYRLAFGLRALGTLALLLSFSYTARFVDPAGLGVQSAGGTGYLAFWLVGIALADVFYSCASGLSRRIRESQLAGTLEAVLSTPAPAGHVLAGLAAVEVGGSLLRAGAIIALGALILDVPLGPVHAGSLALCLVLLLVAFCALGLLAAALTMLLRRTDPISLLLGVAVTLIGGVFYPVDLLPEPLARAAYALPLAPAATALRGALLTGAAPSAITRELCALACFAAVVLPLGIWLFARALARARRDASLGHY